MENIKIIIIIVALILLVPLTFLIQNQPTDKNKISYQNITDDEAKKALEQDESIILLDVRTEEEYNEEHIPNSILIPLDILETEILNKITDKKTQIFVYCRSGTRAQNASEILVNLGYENIYNLGGIIDWKYETE